MKIKDWVLLFVLVSSVVIDTGVIRKDFDPIKNTQTDAISLKQKEEETKDGVKGPPTPSFKFYKRTDFLVKTPMQTPVEWQLPKAASSDRIPEPGEPIPEDLGTEERGTAQQPQAEAAPSEAPQEDWWSETEETKESKEPAAKAGDWQDNW
ncbi:MAG TPA: hypothetical protein VL688_01180 [Verrucomicrobiae bacterium]|jgi:hypothetical protein|nr:hypothetical protein [Verrucomicrobiae bacterium]